MEVRVPLRIADCFFSALVVAPAVVCYWRGTWSIMDTYVFPENKEISGWLSLLIGLTIVLSGYFLQFSLPNILPRKNRISFFFGSRLYTYVFAFGSVNHWRGIWYLLDHYVSATPWGAAGPLLVAVPILVFVRGLVNTFMTAPLFVATDIPEEYFPISRLFNIKPQDNYLHYIYDTVFSVVVVAGLVVFNWHGVWLLLDFGWESFVPHSAQVSPHISSLFLGYGMTLLFMAMQYPAHIISKHLLRHSKVLKVAFEDAVACIGIVSCVGVWHGIWKVLDDYFFPENRGLSIWITHISGFGLLVILGISNSLIVRGFFVDGEVSDGRHNVVANIMYFERMNICRKVLRVTTSEKNKSERAGVTLVSQAYQQEEDAETSHRLTGERK